MLVVALFVGASAPAFADDPPSTSPPSTGPSTSAPSTTAPTTDPGATQPDTTTPTTPPTTAPGDGTPSTTTPPTTTPPTAPDARAPSSADAPTVLVNPALTVTPTTPLTHLQAITIHGTGFTPNVSVGFAECKNNNSGDANDCDTMHTGFSTTDASGAFSAQFTARRILHTNNGDVDCADAPGTCNIGAAKISDYSEHAGAPLTFDPNAPLPPPPTLLAGPLTNLHDGDSVALFGGGFLGGGGVAVVQCSQPSIQTCQTLTTLPTDANGNFITLVKVRRLLATPPFGVTDCADTPTSCQLRVVSLFDYDYEAHVFLDFDPNAPLPATHVTVTPDTGLQNFQSVEVAGTGFPTGVGVQFVQCTSDATSSADCVSGAQFAPITPAGTFSANVTVRRVLRLPSGDVDCAESAGRCSLVSTAFGPNPIVAKHALDFDDSAPLPPPPSITVTPDTDLVQGQSVTVTGTDFAPSSFVQISQCLTASQYQPFCGSGGAGAQTDANGSFTTQFAVRRGTIDYSQGQPAVEDCAESAGYCSVLVSSYDGQDHAEQALDFDASAPISTPDVTVQPRLDLPDRGLVHVHASGFAPHEQVAVSQCIAGTPTYGLSCSFGPAFSFLQADGQGVVDTSMRVHRELTPPLGGVVIIDANGPVDCSDAVGTCVLRVQSLLDPLAVTDVALGFDPTAVAPGPVVTVTPAGPYTDGQQVEVHGSGFTPNATLGLAQCKSGVEANGGNCDSGPTGLFDQFRADADGTFTRAVTLHTQVQSLNGSFDCSAAGSCVLFAANRQDYAAERTSVPIEFASTGVVGVVVEGATQARALAFTGAGSSTTPTAIVGISLLVIGGALVLLSRRRRVRA